MLIFFVFLYLHELCFANQLNYIRNRLWFFFFSLFLNCSEMSLRLESRNYFGHTTKAWPFGGPTRLLPKERKSLCSRWLKTWVAHSPGRVLRTGPLRPLKSCSFPALQLSKAQAGLQPESRRPAATVLELFLCWPPPLKNCDLEFYL